MKNTKSVFSQMTSVVENSNHLLFANSNDFWEGDKRKLGDANPGIHLWVVSQSHTDFFRLNSFPSQKTLLTVVENAIRSYGRKHVDFYVVEIQSLNNHIQERCDRPQGRIQRLTYEATVELINESFTQQISA
jgi:hypothetical protein